MATRGVAICSNCWAPITLDTVVCERCGFAFDRGRTGAELERRRKGLPQTDSTSTPTVSRGKASLLSAAGFAVSIGFLALVAQSVPIVGVLIYGALYFASPFTWGWGLIAGLDAPWPIDRSYLPVAFAAPFPLVGLLVGYAWPFPVRSVKQAANAIGMRFALSLIVLGVIGPLLFMVAPR